MSDFVTFGTAHLITIFIILLIAIILSILSRNLKSKRFDLITSWFLAILVVVNEFGFMLYVAITQGSQALLQKGLPLHICGLAVYLTAYALITHKQIIYELTFFWGLFGALQASITPNLIIGFPSYKYVQFFITHGVVVIGSIYLTLGLNMRPKLKNYWKMFFITSGYTLFITAFNFIFMTNYMFTRLKPNVKTIFLFLDWPGYIIFFLSLGFTLSYFIYKLFDKYGKK